METGKQARAGEIRAQLERILSAEAFSGANRRSRLLRYLVEQELEERPEALKESVIAAEVFDRPPGYDPQVDSVVRVEAGRLRARLAEYYDKAGPDERVRVEIPKGGYRPVFVFRDAAAPEPPVAVAPRRGYRLAWAGLAVVSAATALVAWRMLPVRPAPAAIPSSIAVLPFLNLSGNPGEEYLSDGISDVLTEEMAEFRDIGVVARTSAFQYKGKNVDMREISRNLRVGAVLEGSVARRDGDLVVIAQLIRGSDGFHLWSHTYNAHPQDIPAVEAEIARAAHERLSQNQMGVRESSMTRNPEAHDLYLRAVYEMNVRDFASTRHAIELARQAADKDPAFGQPYVVMAAGESQLTTLLAQAPHAGAQRAWEDISQALERDPANGGAHAQKALLAYTDRWDWPEAEKEFRLSLLSGSRGSAENLYGWCLMTRGRFEEARRRLQAAAELDPLSLGPQLNQVEESLAERKYDEAKKRIDRILQGAPTNPVAVSLALSVAYWRRDCANAGAISQKILQVFPASLGAHLGSWGDGLVCIGSSENPKGVIQTLAGQHHAGYMSPSILASAYAAVGDADGAMANLEKSAEDHEPTLLMIKISQIFDPLRNAPRFIALERKLGLIE